MANATKCPKCKAQQAKWVTLRHSVPVDVFQCQACGTAIEEQDWMAPTLPISKGRCVNCGDRRVDGVCGNCGLSEQEDTEVHQELRQEIGAQLTLLNAAREASKVGRRLIALKLATAAAVGNEAGQGDVARALRIWLLAAVGETLSALEDAKAWVEQNPDPPSLAWASLGQQYQHNGFPGSAADAYAKALAKDPKQPVVRARRAQLLMQMRREGQASEEACLVFDAGGDDSAIALATEVAETLSDLYELQFRDDEVERLLERAGPYVDRSAKMLAHRARIAAVNGKISQAKRDLKAARKLIPEMELYERVERAITPQRTSWWRW